MRRALLLLPLLLGACGLREPLRLPAGDEPPQAPAMASRAQTTDELLAQPEIARPQRVDELLRRSEERRDDRFDLPPGDVNPDTNSSSDPPE